MSQAELERQFEVIDMMLTAHSVLRDRYRKKALAIDVVILCLSAVVSAMTFAEERFASIPASTVKLALQIASMTVFTLSIVVLRVDWKQHIEVHAHAASELARIKQQTRQFLSGLCGESEVTKQIESNSSVLNAIEKIPEEQFLQLKAVHELKVRLSKEISVHPGTTLWLLRLVTVYRANHKLLGLNRREEG